jgi:hypothetical protein
MLYDSWKRDPRAGFMWMLYDSWKRNPKAGFLVFFFRIWLKSDKWIRLLLESVWIRQISGAFPGGSLLFPARSICFPRFSVPGKKLEKSCFRYGEIPSGILLPPSVGFPAGSRGRIRGTGRKDSGKMPFPAGSAGIRTPERPTREALTL